jgi:hypothetical protein
MPKKQRDVETLWLASGTPAGHYAHVIPRIVNYFTIGPEAFRLLIHYWIITGATGKPIGQDNRALAKGLHMGLAQIERAKRELLEVKLAVPAGHARGQDLIMLDFERIWAENFKVFSSEVFRGPFMPKVEKVSVDDLFNAVGQDAADEDSEGLDDFITPEVDDLFADAPEYASPALNEAVEKQTKGRNFKLKPPPGPDNFAKKDSTKTKIPWPFFVTMYRMCFYTDANDNKQVKVLPEKKRGQLAQALAIMYEAGTNLDRLHEFELWWAEQRLSKDRDSGGYRPPTPNEVRSYWGRAMADRDRKKVGSLQFEQAHEDKILEAKLVEIQQAHMSKRK